MLYQLGSWSHGALVREKANPSLIIGKLLSWEADREDGVCQISPVFTTMFYIPCVCEGRVVIIGDQLQMSRKLYNSGVILAICITDHIREYFSGCLQSRIPMLIILTKLEWCDKVNSSLIKFCEYNEFRGYFLFSKWGEVQGCFL